MDILKKVFLENSRHLQISDALYITIKQAIIDNKINYDIRLKEEEISKLLGISRTPVRESLLFLQQTDFIISDSKKGYVIKQYSIKECVDLINYVRIIRRSAAGILAKQITDTELFLLKNLLLNSYEKHLEFHLKIAEYTNNIFLIDEIKKSHEKLLLIYNYYTNNIKNKEKDFPSATYEEEQIKLIKAFSEHNFEKAEDIVDEYSYNLLLVIKKMYTLNFNISIEHIPIYS